MGCISGGYDNFPKDGWGYETLWKSFEHFGMKSYAYLSMGYGSFSTVIEGGRKNSF